MYVNTRTLSFTRYSVETVFRRNTKHVHYCSKFIQDIVCQSQNRMSSIKDTTKKMLAYFALGRGIEIFAKKHGV